MLLVLNTWMPCAVWECWWLELPQLYLSGMQTHKAEAQTWLHCSCWRTDDTACSSKRVFASPTHTHNAYENVHKCRYKHMQICTEMQGWVHSIWICASHARSVSQRSKSGSALQQRSAKKSWTNSTHSPPTAPCIAPALCCCSVLQSLCTVSWKSPINTYQMHDGTGHISGTELCMPAGFTREFTVCQRDTSDGHWADWTGHVCRSCVVSHYCVNILGMIRANALMRDGLSRMSRLLWKAAKCDCNVKNKQNLQSPARAVSPVLKGKVNLRLSSWAGVRAVAAERVMFHLFVATLEAISASV